ncbi:MAG: hypothetical protein J7619_29230 [Dyadobacter sp.]|uniref:hypothetical protein n=1 Tax=Dyadobacter sp. TaxID=1914288 RepID=UPI001B087148|nr:hypothetical protein [Dyadobacter sp.]MBO9616805.1 hypothetical protein [Dyadobacter sp.]
MEKEQVIKALYDANTEASAQLAHDKWLEFYQAASETVKKYLLEEYHKFGEHIISQNRQSNVEMEKVLAEYKNWKLETNQH